MSDNVKVNFTILHDGINKNRRKYDPELMRKSFNDYIEIHKEEINKLIDNIYYEEPKSFEICYIQDLAIRNFLYNTIFAKERNLEDGYRKFIEESKYGRITVRLGKISVPIVLCPTGYGNNIKYDSRRLLDDMGK